MRTLAALAGAMMLVGTVAAPPPSDAPAQKPIRLAMTCFKTGEDSPPASMTKICFYDCLGSPAAITVSVASICPLTINR